MCAQSLSFGSICDDDDRELDSLSFVGYGVSFDRKHNPGACTVTMISNNCALSAGHCLHVLNKVIFRGGDTYNVEKGSIRAISSKIGNNWAVFRLDSNGKTGLSAGEQNGFAELELSLDAPYPEKLWAVSEDTRRNIDLYPDNKQLRSEGYSLGDFGSILYHEIDMGKGSGGALLFDESSKKAYAIHTHGGCNIMGNNKATIIARVPFLVKAINDCVALDHK